MADTEERNQYSIGIKAVGSGYITDSEFKQSLHEYNQWDRDGSYEEFLLEKDYLSSEDLQALKTGGENSGSLSDQDEPAEFEQTLYEPVAPEQDGKESQAGPGSRTGDQAPDADRGPEDEFEKTLYEPVHPDEGTNEDDPGVDTLERETASGDNAEGPDDLGQTLYEPVSPEKKGSGSVSKGESREEALELDNSAEQNIDATLYEPVTPDREDDSSSQANRLDIQEGQEETDRTLYEPVQRSGTERSEGDKAPQEEPELSQYTIGSVAVNQDILSKEEYDEAYFEHISSYENMPFRAFLIYKGYLSLEQVNRLTKIIQEGALNGSLNVSPEAVDHYSNLTDELRKATDMFFSGAGEKRTEDYDVGTARTIQAPVVPGGGGDKEASADRRDSTRATEKTMNMENRPGSSTSITMMQEGGIRSQKQDGQYSENIDKYEIIDEIARGGMGVIYKAKQKDLNRIVALKVMLSGSMASDEDRKRFLREAEACANLDHPNIIQVYEIGLFQENYFFSMDYINGLPLGDYAEEEGEDFTIERKLEITEKVLDAVEYGHQQGIVHRDLKPANIMMNQHGEPVVMDFGLVKKLASEDEDELSMLTATGAVMGTPHYMAPEQAAGRREEIGPATDIFALGIIMYEMFTGERPFTGNNVNEIFNSIFNIDPVSPLAKNSSLDWEIEAIILKALEKQPDLRYASALEMKEDVRRYMDGEPIKAKKISRWYYIKKRIKRHKAVFSLICAIILLVIVGTVWGSYIFVQNRKKALLTRKKELRRIEQINSQNEEYSLQISGLVEQRKFTQAREKRVKIESGLKELQNILKNTEVGTGDSNNYRKIWELSSKELEDKIEKAEKKAEKERSIRKANRLAVEGDKLLKKGRSILKTASKGDKRVEAQRKIAEARRKFGDALVSNPRNEKARKGMFNACVLMGKLLIEDKAFGVMTEEYFRDAEDVAGTPEEKKTLKDLRKAYIDEKNQIGTYRNYISQGKELFSKKDFGSALAKFETAQRYADTEEVQKEIRKTKFKIEKQKAETLNEQGEFFAAVSAFRFALSFTSSEEEVKNVKHAIEGSIKRGVSHNLAKAKQLIKKNHLAEAEKTVKEVLSITRDREALDLLKKIINLKAIPPDMVYIEGGDFIKGTPEKEVGNPTGKARTGDFYIAKYEVTNYNYKKFVDDNGYSSREFWSDKGWKNISKFKTVDGKPGPYFWVDGDYQEGDDDLPVTGISFYEAQAYTRWLSSTKGRKYKLPNELQWEKSASWDNAAHSRCLYPWGDKWDSSYGNFSEELQKIGTSHMDISPAGCFDMAGNAHEWVINTTGGDDIPVFKGGAANLPEPLAKKMAKASYREVPLQCFRGERVGFRIICFPGSNNPEGRK